MKAITIKQPFASLIAAGLKEYEFRTWKTSYRGKVLIHAGKVADGKAMKKFACYELDDPRGLIIAKADLTDCIWVDDAFRNELRNQNALVYSGIIDDPTWEGYAFRLENIEPVEPVSARGMLGLWECCSTR